MRPAKRYRYASLVRTMIDHHSSQLTTAQLQSVVDANPFSSWLQIRVQSVDTHGIELRLPGRSELVGTQALQRLHGGVIASLIDAACGYAVLAASGLGVSTVSLHTDFHRAASLGELRVEGRVLHQGGRICTAEALILDSKGSLVASGRCTIYKARAPHSVLSAPKNNNEAAATAHTR